MFIHSFRFRNILFVGIGVILAVVLGTRLISTSHVTIASTTPEKDNKIVYLTFDDGPSIITADILDLLKEKQIPATFFVTGATTERGKMLYHRIIDEGHSLGLHSYSHKYKEIYASAEAYLADFDRLQSHLNQIVGETPKIFRFPGGSNNINASAELFRQVQTITASRGYVFFDWNALAKDDKAIPTPAYEMFQNIVSTGSDRNRILILMHDDAIRTTAVDCLRLLIDYYAQKGYRFEALTEATPPIQFSNST